jgi:hypothetical protein
MLQFTCITRQVEAYTAYLLQHMNCISETDCRPFCNNSSYQIQAGNKMHNLLQASESSELRFAYTC